jgi:hypothetical protein
MTTQPPPPLTRCSDFHVIVLAYFRAADLPLGGLGELEVLVGLPPQLAVEVVVSNVPCARARGG